GATGLRRPTPTTVPAVEDTLAVVEIPCTFDHVDAQRRVPVAFRTWRRRVARVRWLLHRRQLADRRTRLLQYAATQAKPERAGQRQALHCACPSRLSISSAWTSRAVLATGPVWPIHSPWVALPARETRATSCTWSNREIFSSGIIASTSERLICTGRSETFRRLTANGIGGPLGAR